MNQFTNKGLHILYWEKKRSVFTAVEYMSIRGEVFILSYHLCRLKRWLGLWTI